MAGKKKHYQTDWKRVDTIKDEDIDYSDIPEVTDEQFEKAIFVPAKNIYWKVESLRVIGDYAISVRFIDGLEGVVRFQPCFFEEFSHISLIRQNSAKFALLMER